MNAPGYAQMIAKKRSLTIEKKREEKMKGMSDAQKKKFIKKCRSIDRDNARKLKQLAALRKVFPEAKLKDIAIARKEGWLPSID